MDYNSRHGRETAAQEKQKSFAQFEQEQGA